MPTKPHPNPGKPFLIQALVVAWRGNGDPKEPNAPKKVSHYDLLIQKFTPDFEIFVYEGKEIPLPKCETLIRTRITKGNAKILMDYGLKPTAAYFTGK